LTAAFWALAQQAANGVRFVPPRHPGPCFGNDPFRGVAGGECLAQIADF
jgi:hypothetical protein